MRYRLVGRNIQDLLPLLEQYSDPVRLSDDSTEEAELIICHGGDGTLLGAERTYPGIPKLTIRDRAINPKCPLHGEEELLAQFFSGHMQSQLLPTLNGTCSKGTLCGLNDIVIARKVQLGAIRYRIRQNGRMLCPMVISDGLVICTPFGSTGYFQSITRGHFQHGLGLAYNNPMDGESFTIMDEQSTVEVEILRGPATVMADNNPNLIELSDGDILNLHFGQQRTQVFGLEAFRCPECHHLRVTAAAGH